MRKVRLSPPAHESMKRKAAPPQGPLRYCTQVDIWCFDFLDQNDPIWAVAGLQQSKNFKRPASDWRPQKNIWRYDCPVRPWGRPEFSCWRILGRLVYVGRPLFYSSLTPPHFYRVPPGRAVSTTFLILG